MENGNSRLQQAQQEVEDVRVIMLDNFNKTDERSDKLGQLDIRAEELAVKSKVFTKNVQKLTQQKRWEHMKTKVALVAVGVVALAIVIGVIAYYISESMKSESDKTLGGD